MQIFINNLSYEEIQKSLFEIIGSDDESAELKKTVCYAIGLLDDKHSITKSNNVFRSLVKLDSAVELRFEKSATLLPLSIEGAIGAYNFDNSVISAAMVMLSDSNATNYGSFSPSELGLSKKKSYFYYEYFTEDFGYINGDEYIYYSLNNQEPCKYYTFVEKGKNGTIFLGRTDKLNHMMAIKTAGDDYVELIEGGEISLICDEDYILSDESGEEIECDRYGIILRGECDASVKNIRMQRCE